MRVDLTGSEHLPRSLHRLETEGVSLPQFDTSTSMVATRHPISPQAAARYQERWTIARERLNERILPIATAGVKMS